ncbi:hypothetical protein SAMN05660489_06263 [Pseudomonas sp. LAMO17WK12:I10]|uniref:hypothetical protein n=1 Tax=unclassified Pseudomonas TaxID=196821 RepID=UPI000BD31DEA|nr:MULTISPECIES: hypothetical protein [unclassified Pseudomonas]PXX51837.1 hypothetical protein H160_06277 [Pseudomonas sp. LAMO17WK12:I9]SNY53610.1 hypothetical protein SAMN05660489_06263 [Pseudomonas sp. LAMO17WK12:I10]
MSHIKARVEALRELVKEIKNVETIFERAALFAAIRVIADDLCEDEGLDGYAHEKAYKVKWHAGAALGFDETNGHPLSQHRVWALGELGSLESVTS